MEPQSTDPNDQQVGDINNQPTVEPISNQPPQVVTPTEIKQPTIPPPSPPQSPPTPQPPTTSQSPTPQPPLQQTATISQPMIYRQNSPEYSDKTTNKRGLIILSIIIAAVIILLVGGLVYFWLLPSHNATAYQKNVKTAYQKQLSKMDAAYSTFSLPVFSQENTDETTDQQNFTQATTAINNAKSVTTELQKQNDTKMLPLATLFGVGKSAVKESDSVKDYIIQSQNYLNEYNKLVVYLKAINEGAVMTDSAAVDSASAAMQNSKTPQLMIQNAQTTIAAINKVINDLKSLQPPEDLKDINSNLITDFTLLRSGLSNIISGLNNHSASQITTGTNQISQAGDGLNNIFTSNTTNKLQTTSSLMQQIQNLKKLEPID